MPTLQLLDISETRVTDRGLLALSRSKELGIVVARRCNVTAEALAQAREMNPRLYIIPD